MSKLIQLFYMSRWIIVINNHDFNTENTIVLIILATTMKAYCYLLHIFMLLS